MLKTAKLIFLAVCCAPVAGLGAQAPSPQPAASQAPPPAAAGAPAAGAPAPSGMLQPSLDTLKETIGSLKLDKWKGGSVRTEATANVNSIQRDLQETLPGLLKDADGAPNSLGTLLPLHRNLDALYDVVLRVYDAARVSGPGDQVAALQAAMSSLEGGRRSLNDRLVSLAAAQEKQITQLQSSLAAKPPAPVCPVVAPPPPAAPVKKAVRKKKPAATKDQPANPPSKSPATGSTTPKPTTPQ